MKFRQPISGERQQLKQEARHGLGRMTNEEIRDYVEAEVTNLAGAKKLLRQILRNQRDLTRRIARLKD